MKDSLQKTHRLVIVFGICMIFFCANNLFAAEWSLSRLGKTHTVNLSSSGNNSRLNISGHYIGIQNNSKFTGTVYQDRGKTLIHFVQLDGTYVAIHSGIKIDDNTFSGVFYDNSGNEAKKFTLSRGGFSF
ncbi:MAG: hypothetical protein D3915_01815 [Candidatus Electrothrix sp. AU1_5]|nr:hypothetical protein [Candidatus Electrothrix gigas]